MKRKLLILFFILFISPVFSVESLARTVMLNTKTGIYHNQSCPHAKRCTVNCVKTDSGNIGSARACKVCGG